eukprot:g6513.t1
MNLSHYIMAHASSVRRFVLSSSIRRTGFNLPQPSTRFDRFSAPLKQWSPLRRVQSRQWGTFAAASGNGSVSESVKEFDYDLFAVGAGSGGVRAARQSAARGAKVAICELPYSYVSSDAAGGVGGTCVLRGCVPKKLMVYGSEYASEFSDSKGFGWNLDSVPEHNWNTLLENKRKELDRLNGVYKRLLEGSGVDLIEGRGSILDSHTVEVNGRQYTARYILIATGGRAQRLNVPGAEHTITSDEALELANRPNKIAIIGGGYIAVEFAGIFNSFGTETHLMYRADRPLRGFDEETRSFITEQYKEEGLVLHPGHTPNEIRKLESEKLELVAKNTSGEELTLSDLDHVFMATGRKPNTANLGLEQVGVEIDKKGAIRVNNLSQTTVPSIYAIGDVTDRIALTPVALMEAMALTKTLFDEQPTEPDHKNVASAVFSQPPLATVGFTEEEAIEEFGNVDIYTSAFRPLKNTISGNLGRAFMKLIVDVATDKVIGVHMVGPDCAEIMQGMGVAVKLGVTKAELDSVVGIHPTAAEEFVTMRSVTRQIRNKTAVAL